LDRIDQVRQVFFGLVQKAYAFLKIVNRLERTHSIFHPDLTCLSAFSFISSNYEELRENISKIICKLQKQRQNRYIHVTFAYFHSFAIELVFNEDEFKCYMYEPNYYNQPSTLYNADEIARAIESSIRYIKLSVFLTFNYSFWKDHSNLISFYIYPAAKYEKKDYLIEKIERRILACQEDLRANFSLKSEAEITLTQTIKTSKSSSVDLVKLQCISAQLVEEIGVLIDNYKKKKGVRGILLNNLSILLIKLQAESNLNFNEEIIIIKKILKKHIFTLDFEPVKNNKHKIICYSYSRELGDSILLHEVARMGDIEATEVLLPYSDLSLRNCSKRTPLLTAVEGAEFSVIKVILKFICQNIEATLYIEILKDLQDQTFNIFNSSGGYNSTYIVINNILNFIDYEKKLKNDLCNYDRENSTWKISRVLLQEKCISPSELIQAGNNNVIHVEKEIEKSQKSTSDINLAYAELADSVLPII
jgi:hypothetical protein